MEEAEEAPLDAVALDDALDDARVTATTSERVVSRSVVREGRGARSELPLDADAPQEGTVLTEDALQRAPAGRSYQAAIQMAAGLTGRRSRNREAAPSPPAAPPPPPAFPQGGAAADTHPTSGAAAPSHPAQPAAGAAFPRRSASSASSLPRRPSPPPAAAWGLDIPAAIEASTLSLSLPETGTGLRVEQRLVPAGEPLSLDLSYRFRSRR